MSFGLAITSFCVFLCQALQTLESRLKLLSGETGLSVEQKIAEVQDSVRKAKVRLSDWFLNRIFSMTQAHLFLMIQRVITSEV